MNTLTKYFPWIVVGVLTLYAAGKMYPEAGDVQEFDLSTFGEIPVLDGGRIKPLDSVARANMLFISGRSDWEDPQGYATGDPLAPGSHGRGRPDASPDRRLPVFRIDNEQVLAELGLEYRPGITAIRGTKSARPRTSSTSLRRSQAREDKKAAG